VSEKRSLRKDILEQRNNQGSKEMMEKSKRIEERLFEMAQFKEAQTIMFYASFKSEVKTESMIRKALALGKRVVLPILETQRGELIASRIQDFDQDLQPGAYGILEPKQTQPVDPSKINMVILPGIVFDTRGHRLGYGGGCYDKFLNKINSQTLLVGLAYELQLANEVPNECHDIPAHKIVTEERVIDCLPVGRHDKGGRFGDPRNPKGVGIHPQPTWAGGKDPAIFGSKAERIGISPPTPGSFPKKGKYHCPKRKRGTSPLYPHRYFPTLYTPTSLFTPGSGRKPHRARGSRCKRADSCAAKGSRDESRRLHNCPGH